MLSASRLRHAIKRRRTTQAELANQIGVAPKTVTRWLESRCEPEHEKLVAISHVLRLPPDFFEAPRDLEEIDHERPSFRARRASKRLLDAAAQAAAIAFDIERVLVEDLRFRLPPRDVPELPDLHTREPEAAAAWVRSRWGLAERPIRSMVALLETHGVRVFSLPPDLVDGKVSAFCVENAAGTPFVLLNTRDAASGERTRFDCAHELGHLVMHRRIKAFGDECEREADRFAAAFLMPRSSVIEYGRSANASVSSLARLKKRWGVSVAALARRLLDLGIFSQAQYRRVCMELSRRGRRNEPQPIRAESSRLLPKIQQALKGEGGFAMLAERVLLYEPELTEYVFGLTMTSLAGAGKDTVEKPPPALSLVNAEL